MKKFGKSLYFVATICFVVGITAITLAIWRYHQITTLPHLPVTQRTIDLLKENYIISECRILPLYGFAFIFIGVLICILSWRSRKT